MKNFLKYTLATIVGIMIVHVILFFIFIGFIGAIASFSEKTVTVKNNSILTIKLEGEILDRTSDNPLDNIDFLSFTPKKNLGLNKILASIQKAAKDSRIQGIYLDLTEIQGNFGALAFTQEIRNALQKFKESGKFIYSYSNLGYSQKSYYLATVADKIFVNPETPLLLTGMSSSISFYKETLAKLGIQPEVVKVGKFKSAVEPFISDEMSPANRDQARNCRKPEHPRRFDQCPGESFRFLHHPPISGFRFLRRCSLRRSDAGLIEGEMWGRKFGSIEPDCSDRLSECLGSGSTDRI